MSATYFLPQPSQHYDDRVLHEVLPSGPAYARTRQATRWHRVRSAVTRYHSWDDSITTIYHLWCGQFASTGSQRSSALTTDTVPQGEPSCGTCEGRWRGAQEDHPWLFVPRPDQRPKKCPGSRTATLYEGDWPTYRCLVCGVHVGGWCGGGYSGTWGLRTHAPGPDLIPPCGVHGYLRLVVNDGRAECACEKRATS